MVNFLRNWAEELMIGVFLTIIIEMLVPNGNIKKYVKVISGIYIIFLIINPIISNIKTIDLEEILNTDIYSEETAMVSNIEIGSVYKIAIENEIKEQFSDIEDVEISFSNDLEDIEKVEITLNSDARKEEISNFITENYGISSGGIVWHLN
jgi:stage III sporulation protein AF